MAKNRSLKIRSAKLIEQSDSVILLVDSNFVIRMVNAECCQWINLPEDELIGLSCVYTSAELDNPLKNRVSGLCPSPEVFDGNITQQIIFRRDASGEKAWRSASTTPLNVHGETMALIVAPAPDSPSNTLPGDQVLDEFALRDALALMRTRDQRMYRLDDLVGKSSFANHTRQQVLAAIENQAQTLIHGPEGTGREFFARTIFHERSKKGDAGESLFPVHCEVADGQQIQRTIKHWIEDQHQQRTIDCLLLLEADKLDTSAQNELLGFINMPGMQIRTLATSKQSLTRMAEAGEFSIDLANFLSVQTIQTFPLSRRLGDLPLLVQAIIENENASSEKQISSASPAALELLAEYDWPRNIDQLREIIQSAVENSAGSTITPSDLPERIHHAVKAIRVGKHEVTKIKLDEFLEEVEAKLIKRAMRQAKNTKSKAAAMLGISRPRLLRRLETLGVGEDAPVFEELEIVDSSAFEEEPVDSQAADNVDSTDNSADKADEKE